MRTITLVLALLLIAALAQAEAPRERPPEDPLASKLFPPELIMSHQDELGVDDKQRGAILKEIEKAQPQMLQLQWQLHSATEQLAKLLDAAPVEEAKALGQADRVMGLERDLKRTQLGLLIRIKNLLTDAQRARLAGLRKAAQ